MLEGSTTVHSKNVSSNAAPVRKTAGRKSVSSNVNSNTGSRSSLDMSDLELDLSMLSSRGNERRTNIGNEKEG